MTLQTTALVHEAYLRLFGATRPEWVDRSHFFRLAARVMRNVLTDQARHRLSRKRGGGVDHLPLDESLIRSHQTASQVLALGEALESLSQKDERVHSVVELRFFTGLSIEETAEVLGISTRSVKRDWTFGRAWLRSQLTRETRDAGTTLG